MNIEVVQADIALRRRIRIEMQQQLINDPGIELLLVVIARSDAGAKHITINCIHQQNAPGFTSDHILILPSLMAN